MRPDGITLQKHHKRPLLYLGSLGASLLLLIAVLATSAAAVNLQSDVEAASAHLLFADDNRLGFVLRTPIESIVAGSDLHIPGLSRSTTAAGLPALPYFSSYVVLPPESNPRLTIRQSDPVIKSGLLLPAEPIEFIETGPLLGDEFDGLPELSAGYAPEAIELPMLHSTGLFPPRMAEISEPMMVRDVRLVRVTVYPIRYDSGRQTLVITPEVELIIDFDRPARVGPLQLAPSVGDQHLASIAASVLNHAQIQGFRALPETLGDASTALPLGEALFKITVSNDGIHQLTYSALKQAGLAVDDVDPATLAMSYRGQPIATAFAGDTDEEFEPGEAIRFYGQAFHGSRLERQFISSNIYWLRAGDQALRIQSVASIPGQTVTATMTSITREPEIIYFPGYTNYWPENEPDAWYWDWWAIRQTPVTRTFTVTLPNPTTAGPVAHFTAEFSSRDSHISNSFHSVTVTMNGFPTVASNSWWGEKNFNVSASVPPSTILNGANNFAIRAETAGTSAYLALNRITVDYRRWLQALGDQLVFSDLPEGPRQYQVRGFSSSERNDFLAWDIANPYSPTAILTTSLGISGTGPYTVTFGTQGSADARYIITTVSNIREPAAITPYVAPQIDPPGGADWVAIAHEEFITETRRLASHRADPDFGGLRTHVVNIDDITNQYGYGLPIPAAIRDYLIHALADWSVKPSYVVLVGDTTLDPRHIKPDWTDQQYVPTDLAFVDPYQGVIPSDLTFALLSGDDLLPDLAVGRVAVETVAELDLVVDKIVRYENNQRLSFGWMQNFLYVSDKNDPSAGNFCEQSAALAGRLPSTFNDHLLCLDDYAPGGVPDAAALRADMTAFLEGTGVTMLTYRGHGAIDYWGGNPIIYQLTYATKLKNTQPFVAISGDCLDGHYAYPPYEGLGERLFNFWAPSDDSYGAAAHWGSSGLGISSDHTDILNGFYDGVFSAGATAIGDAVSVAKLAYYGDPFNDPALMYSFNLQGDPAMQLMRPDIELSAAWQTTHFRPGKSATLSLTVKNHGLYPSQVTLIGEPISGFTIAAVTSTVSYSLAMIGDTPQITLQFGNEINDQGIPRNGQATVNVTYDISTSAAAGRRAAHYTAQAAGLDAWPGDEQIHEEFVLLRESQWLPLVRR